MKILIITAATFSVPRFRLDMIDEFIKRGADVVVAGDEPKAIWHDLFKAHRVKYRTYRVSRNGMNPLRDLTTFRDLREIIKQERPDKIFTYQAKGNIYGCLACRSVGISDVYPMMGGIGSVFMPTNWAGKLVQAILTLEYRAAFKKIRSVFFQNHDDAALFEKLKIVDGKKIVYTCGSGVNLNKFPQAPLPDKTVFLFVGRLIKDKGIYEYLHASRILRREGIDAEFHVVGGLDSNPSAITEEELRVFIDEGSIVWHGWQDDVLPYLNNCSVFVLPSYREGTPKAALEAMSVGRAVIVADSPGCREVVRKGVNGLVVPVGDPLSLAEAMRKLSLDKHTVERMADESRRFAEEVFDVEQVNSTICEAMGI